MNNNEKIQIGWRLPQDLKDRFSGFCDKPSSDSMEEEAAGAIYVYMHLPQKIRELAKLEAKSVPMVDPAFWDDFGRGLELGIKAQLNIQQKPRDVSQKK